MHTPQVHSAQMYTVCGNSVVIRNSRVPGKNGTTREKTHIKIHKGVEVYHRQLLKSVGRRHGFWGHEPDRTFGDRRAAARILDDRIPAADGGDGRAAVLCVAELAVPDGERRQHDVGVRTQCSALGPGRCRDLVAGHSGDQWLSRKRNGLDTVGRGSPLAAW